MSVAARSTCCGSLTTILSMPCLALVLGVVTPSAGRAEPPTLSKTESSETALVDRSLLRLLRYARVVPVDQLRSALRHENPEVRRLALQRWSPQEIVEAAQAKPPREPDRQPLFAALDDPSPVVRGAAAQLVGNQGTHGESAAPRLAEMVWTDSIGVRTSAARALGRIGLRTPEIHAALSAAAREEGALAAQAIVALLALKSDRGFVALRHADDAARLLVAKSLFSHEITDLRDRVFLQLIADSNPEIRAQALTSLEGHCASRDLVIWQTLQGLHDPDSAVRSRAASLLWHRIELETPDEYARAMQLIVKLPSDSTHRETAWCCFKKPVEEQTGTALKFLRDAEQDERSRIELAGVLTRCMSIADDDLEADELADEIEKMALEKRLPLAIRIAAAETLCGDYLSIRDGFPKTEAEYAAQFRPLFLDGVKANILLPLRLMALHRAVIASREDAAARRVIDEVFQQEFRQRSTTAGNMHWRSALFDAAYRSRPDDADRTSLLSFGVHDSDAGMRSVSARLLKDAVWNRRFSPDEAMLVALLNDADLEIRRAALQAMTERGPKTDGMKSRIFELLDDPDRSLRRDAMLAWKRLGMDLSPILNRQLERLARAESVSGNEPEILESSAFAEEMEALLEVSCEDPRVVAAVLRTLNREEGLNLGLMWLTKLGPAGREAFPTLLALLDEPAEGLVGRAAHAVGFLGPVARPALPKLRGFLTGTEREFARMAAMSVLRLDPADTAAQDIVVKNVIAEFQLMWCYSSPPAWSCVLSLKRDGLPTLRKILLSPETNLVGSPLESLYHHWDVLPSSREYEYLEPLLREFLEDSETGLGIDFRASLKRRANSPER